MKLTIPLVVVVTTATTHAQADAPLAAGRIVRFEIDETSPRFAAPGLAEWTESAPGQRFTFASESGGLHTFELKSALCDSYLIVRTPDGEVVAETGFGPYGEHARLEVEVEPGVDYLVDACSFEGFGTLRLFVHAGKIERPGGAASAQEVLGDATATLAARRRALGDDHERVLAAYADLGSLSWRFGRYRKALAAYESVLQILEQRDEPDRPRIAFAHEQIGAQHAELGELDEAEAAFRTALSLYEAAGKPEAATQALSGISRVLKARGNLREALGLDRRALDLLTRGEDGVPWLIAVGHNNVASSLQALGHEREAAQHYRAARDLFRAEPDAVLNRCICDRNLATLLLERGRVRAASALFEEVARHVVDEIGWFHPRAFPMVLSAAFYRLRAGYPTEARALARATIAALSDGRAREARVSVVQMEGLAECLAGTELGIEQERLLDTRARAGADSPDAGVEAAVGLLQLGRRLCLRGDAAGATAALRPAIEIADGPLAPATRAMASLWLARALRAMDDGQGAVRVLRRMEPELEGTARGEWMRSVARLETARLNEGPHRFETACQAFDLGRAYLERWLWIAPRGEALAMAFHVSSCLDELVVASGTGRARLAEAYERVRAFARTWSTLTGLSRERTLEGLSEERRDQLLRARLSLHAPAQERVARIVAVDRELAALDAGPPAKAMTLEQIAAALPERSAWVDASVHWTPGGARAFAWVVRSGEPRAHRVALGSLGELAARADELAALLSRRDAVFVRFAEPFDTMPPHRLEALLGNERITLLDTPARLVEARPPTRRAQPIEEVVVLAAGGEAARIEEVWQPSGDGPRLRTATDFGELGAAELVHVALESAASPGPLTASWAMTASHASITRNVIDVAPGLTLPWPLEAGLELSDGSTVTAAEIADLDLSGCGVVVLEVGPAGMTAGLAAVTRAFLHAGTRAVALAGDGDRPWRELVAAVTAGSTALRKAARDAGMAVVGDIE